jgi:hypothetical protein
MGLKKDQLEAALVDSTDLVARLRTELAACEAELIEMSVRAEQIERERDAALDELDMVRGRSELFLRAGQGLTIVNNELRLMLGASHAETEQAEAAANYIAFIAEGYFQALVNLRALIGLDSQPEPATRIHVQLDGKAIAQTVVREFHNQQSRRA